MREIRFPYQPHNRLEAEGRTAEPLHGEAEKTCPNCHVTMKEGFFRSRGWTCSCGYHFRLGARQRIAMIADKGSFQELFDGIGCRDPLAFPGYGEKAAKARAVSGERESAITGTACIDGMPCALFAMEAGFMMGSMGTACGEKIARLFEYAAGSGLPVIGFTVSGGARMQEGLLSLMQMAKTSGAVRRHSRQGLLYIAVLTDPTTGGVTASFAMEGDIILAEPGATIGFAGARVVAQTTRQPLPKGFQSAESLLEHGFIDAIVPRAMMRKALSSLLAMHRRVI